MPKRDRLRNLLSAVARPWKQKQERAQVDAGKEPVQESGTSTSAVCELCRNLDPDDPAFGDLFLWSSSPGGVPRPTCQFCQFIYDAATAMVPAFASDSQIHASIESVPSRNKLDLRFGGRLALQVYTRPGTFLRHQLRATMGRQGYRLTTSLRILQITAVTLQLATPARDMKLLLLLRNNSKTANSITPSVLSEVQRSSPRD
jgi:hypothetical protein